MGEIVKTARGIIVNGICEVTVRKYGIRYGRPTRSDAGRSVASPSHRALGGGIERWLWRPKVDGPSNRHKQLTQIMTLSETRSLAGKRQGRTRMWNKY